MRRLPFMLALCCSIGSACAPRATVVDHESGTVRPAHTDTLALAVDHMLSRFAERGMAGNVLLFRDDRLVLARSVNPPLIPPGSKRIDFPDQFDMGSITKTFTAAAVLQLAAAGKLSPNDSLGRYVPDLPPDRAGITLHHLLTHTSGYPLDAPDAGVPANAGWAELFAAARTSRLLFPPGRQYSYSNFGYSLLAGIVERVSAMRFEDYVMQRLVGAAGMSRSRMYGDSLPDADMAPSFRLDAGGLLVPDTIFLRGKPNGVLWGKYALGAGGMISTVHDIAAWWRALQGDAVLGPRERDLMFAPWDGSQGYGWTINTSPDSVPRIYRGGARGGYRTLLARYPHQRVLLIYAINSDAGWDGALWRGVERLLARKSPPVPPPVAQLTREALQPFTGRYVLPGGGHFDVRDRIGPGGPEIVVAADGQLAMNALREPSRSGAPSYEVENTGTIAIVAALVADTALPASFHVDSASVRRNWKDLASLVGRIDSTRVIGSLPLPAPRPRVQTLVALYGQRGKELVRLGWQEGKSFGFGGMAPVGVQFAFLPSDEGSFTSFEPSSGMLRTIRFVAARNAPLTLEVVDGTGRVVVRAPSIP